MSIVVDAPGFGRLHRRAVIRLRVDRFNLMTSVLGMQSDLAQADLLGVNPKTVYRAKLGNFGHDFIAQTLVSLGDRRDELGKLNLCPTFDELFEVVDTTTGAPAH